MKFNKGESKTIVYVAPPESDWSEGTAYFYEDYYTYCKMGYIPPLEGESFVTKPAASSPAPKGCVLSKYQKELLEKLT